MALYRYGYGRVSSADQNLERQLYLFEQIGVDNLYLEKISGGRRDRPEFLRLVEDALARRAEGHEVIIVVLDLSRWARDTAYSLDMLDRLEKAGIKVQEGSGQPVTLATAQGLLDVGVKSIFAHYFRLNLSDQAKKANARKRLQGKPLSAAAPLGYQRAADQSSLEPGPQWAIARALVEKFLGESCSLSDLSRWLYQTHNIKRSPQGLSDWLQNPHLRGHLYYRQEKRIIYNTHPPLITESEYKSIERRLSLNRQLRGRNKGAIHPVPSIVFCQACGGKCSTSFNDRHRYFYCYRSRRSDCEAPFKYCREDWIEAAIQEAFAELAETVADTLLTASTEAATDPRVLQLEAEILQLQPLAHRPSIAAEIEQMRSELQQLKTAPDQSVGAAERRDIIVGLATLGPEGWAAFSAEERREIYSDLVEFVVVLGREVQEVRLRV